MAAIMLVGKDWTSRALLRAKLMEEGVEVEAHESVSIALRRLQASKTFPQLLLVDLAQSENPAQDIAELARWSKLLAIWVMAGHGLVASEALQGRGFEKVLFRPLEVGKLVEQIKARLGS